MEKSHPAKFFHGDVCNQCGGTERYKSNKRCRNCNNLMMRVQNAKRREKRIAEVDQVDMSAIESARLYNKVLSMRWSA